MSIRKLRDVADTPPPPPLRRLDPENLRRAHALSALAYRLHPWPLQPGVRKFGSLAERKAGGRSTAVGTPT